MARLLVSGAPARSWARDLHVGLVSKWERALRRLERVPMTTIAVASGDCGGLALDALLTTDYRIATSTVRLLLPVAESTVWPGMAVYRLSQQTDVAGIRRAVLFGHPIGAEEALELHVVDEVVGDPEDALAAGAGTLRAFSGRELAIRRRLILDATTTSFEEALGVHLAACDRALRRSSDGMDPKT
jgi:isomerase DpgB